MELVQNEDIRKIIMKSLMAAKLFDGFWDRWVAHGVDRHELASIRSSFTTQEEWMEGWQNLAEKSGTRAEEWLKHGEERKAEIEIRRTSLYYQMMQWLIPGRSEEKAKWLMTSIDVFQWADELSSADIKYESIQSGNNVYLGRVCKPLNPKGVIIMINPFDSTKEELFTYEMDFVEYGYTVMNFDGPGQGETFSNYGVKATTNRWQQYVDQLIDYAKKYFPGLSIHLFGTSSGASWALYGSCSPYVSKTVSISPAFYQHDIQLPDYFKERTAYLVEGEDSILPPIENLDYHNPVMLVHGMKDVMVPAPNIYALYHRLPDGKVFIEYEEEGHCCNFQLTEIRRQLVKWLEISEGKFSYEY